MSSESLTNTASPVQIPGSRQCSQMMRPMGSSIEGLNQEIERLVLHPEIAGRANRLDQVSALRFTPEHAFHGRSRSSARSHTPMTDFFESLSPTGGSTPVDGPPGQPPRSFCWIGSADASPRINNFMAQLPPEGCEKVQLSRTSKHQVVADEPSNMYIVNKPVAGFQLRPSEGSAFRVASGGQPDADKSAGCSIGKNAGTDGVAVTEH